MVWSVDGGDEPLTSMHGHEDDVTRVAFSPDGKLLATASRDRTVRLWDALTKEQESPELKKLEGHDSSVLSVAFSPDGTQLATCSTDKTAILWDLARDSTGSLSDAKVARRFYDHTDSVASAEFSQNGRCLVTASLDRTARLWNVENGRQLLKLGGHGDGVESAAFRPQPGDPKREVAEGELCGDELATASWDGWARRWNIGPTAEKATFTGHLGPVESVDYSPDGSRIVSGSDDGTAKVWDATTGKLLLDLTGQHSGRVNRVAYSPDGRYIATASWDGSAGLWDATSGSFLARFGQASEGLGRDTAQIRVFEDKDRALHGLAFAPGGKTLATAGNSGQVDVWEVPSDDAPDTPFTAIERLYSVRFDPKGAVQLTTGGDGKIYAWKTVTPDEWQPFQYGEDVIYDAAFNPVRPELASVSWDGSAQVWSLQEDGLPSEDAPRVLSGHTDRVYGVGFTPDGKQLITSSADGTALVRDATTWQIVRALYGPEFNALDISNDGETVVIGGEDGSVRLYALNADELFKLAQTRVTRELTDEERKRYLVGAP